MHPFFIARGPAFNKGQISEPFNNVDIYPLMCHILGIEPHKHDGAFQNVKHILVNGDDNNSLFRMEFNLTVITCEFITVSLSLYTVIESLELIEPTRDRAKSDNDY